MEFIVSARAILCSTASTLLRRCFQNVKNNSVHFFLYFCIFFFFPKSTSITKICEISSSRSLCGARNSICSNPAATATNKGKKYSKEAGEAKKKKQNTKFMQILEYAPRILVLNKQQNNNTKTCGSLDMATRKFKSLPVARLLFAPLCYPARMKIS